MVTEKERMLLEIIIAIVFVVFLIIGSIVIINASKGSKTETTITNSFNTYNYNTYPNTQSLHTTLTTKPHIIDDGYNRVYYLRDGVRYRDDSQYTTSDKRYLYYDSDSEFKVVGELFGNDINKYEIYVKNRDYAGGNFKVVFFFVDHYGNVDSQAMTYYIPTREEKMFLLKDVSPSRYDYRKGGYTVDSLSKVKMGHY